MPDVRIADDRMPDVRIADDRMADARMQDDRLYLIKSIVPNFICQVVLKHILRVFFCSSETFSVAIAM